jgi:hypothetical protein
MLRDSDGEFMRIVRLLIVIALTVVLAGCANNKLVQVSESLEPASPDKGGIVFGSIGVGPSSEFDSHVFSFRESGGKGGAIAFKSDFMSRTPRDFRNDLSQGAVFFARLRPGDYEITGASFYVGRGQFSHWIHSREKFSIPFRVKEGHASYLGEFLSGTEKARNLIGIPIPVGGYFVVSDRYERDLAILRTKEGVGELAKPEKAVIDVKAIDNPFFRTSTP